jgi:hypothetical protein
MGRSHESGSLLMSRQDELDRGPPQLFNETQVLLAGDAENLPNALVL